MELIYTSFGRTYFGGRDADGRNGIFVMDDFGAAIQIYDRSTLACIDTDTPCVWAQYAYSIMRDVPPHHWQQWPY